LVGSVDGYFAQQVRIDLVLWMALADAWLRA
jgi:hypothetical protein